MSLSKEKLEETLTDHLARPVHFTEIEKMDPPFEVWRVKTEDGDELLVISGANTRILAGNYRGDTIENVKWIVDPVFASSLAEKHITVIERPVP